MVEATNALLRVRVRPGSESAGPPMIEAIPSRSNARIVVLRTFPREPSSSKNADMLYSSGASKMPRMSCSPMVQ